MNPDPGGQLITDPPDPDPQNCKQQHKNDWWDGLQLCQNQTRIIKNTVLDATRYFNTQI